MSVQLSYAPEEIEELCQRWKVKELALFGSVLRDDFRPDSDVDVLVAFADDAGWSLFDFITMASELAELFGREVDLVEKQGLRNPFKRAAILGSKEVIYAS